MNYLHIHVLTLCTEKAISEGMDKNVAVWLVSTTGITNTLGRVICGWISSYESVDPIMVNNVSLTFGGLYTILLPMLPYSVFSYYLYASLFGFSMGKRAAVLNRKDQRLQQNALSTCLYTQSTNNALYFYSYQTL